jgi:hypothetical protein
MGNFWKNAFAIDKEREYTFTAEETDLCDRVAKKIVGHGMAIPAILFIETARPMNYLGSQAMAFFEPIVKGLLTWDDYTRFRLILERRGSIDLLLGAVERAESARSSEAMRIKAEGRPGFFVRAYRRFRSRRSGGESS